MHTRDKNQENFKKLAALFPNAVTETIKDGKIVRAIDKDVLMQEISAEIVEGKDERYQFTWPDKKQAVLLANSPTTKTLRPCKEESVNFDITKNLYIEGDNLEVLKLLQETYLGKVKMIYIDPPYNTGNDSFVYDDKRMTNAEEYGEIAATDENGNLIYDFKNNPESNGYFHTDWLNMMYPRLRLAKDLLADDGVIFISIDDNEVTNLKKICDEIFGEGNFVGQITVVGNPRGRDYGGIARMHDYLFVYKKSNNTNINLIKDNENNFTMFDELGGFELRELRNRNIRFNKENRPNLYYPFYINPLESDENGLHTISLEFKKNWVELFPLESQGINTVWRWGKAKSKQNININIKAKPMRNGSFMIVEKYRESRVMARSVWWDKDVNTEKGTLLVKELMNGKIFDYPKSVEMLMRNIEMGTDIDNNDIILDFFSGSATTAHAVMQLNAEDKGNRQFIMVQLPEVTDEKSEAYKAGYKNICEIGKERIRRAGKKILADNNLTEKDLDIGFRVLKLDSTNMKDVYYVPAQYNRSLMQELETNIKEDRSAEDLLFQVLLDLGIELSCTIETTTIQNKTLYNVNANFLIACFDTDLSEEIITEAAKQKPQYAVFRDSSLSSDTMAVNFEQIFKTYSPETVTKVL